MKMIGILRVKDEADLLPSVLANVSDGVDEIYAYDDGSTDDTLAILKKHPKVTFIQEQIPDFKDEVYKTKFLEDKIKELHPEYQTEEVWTTLLAGDLYWINTSPKEAAIRAHKEGHDLQTGVAINFSLNPALEWAPRDTWPEWKADYLREISCWCAIIEELPVIWKVANYTSWKRLPWPRDFKSRKVGIVKDTIWLEHPGKRSPKHFQFKCVRNDSYPKDADRERWKNDLEYVTEYGRKLGYWNNERYIPWTGPETIDTLLALEEMSGPERDRFYEGIQYLNRIDPQLYCRGDI